MAGTRLDGRGGSRPLGRLPGRGGEPPQPPAGFASGRGRAPFPDPFLGSDRPRRRLPAGYGVVGPARSLVGGISPRGAIAPRAATVTRIASLGRFSRPLVSGGLGRSRSARRTRRRANTVSPPVA